MPTIAILNVSVFESLQCLTRVGFDASTSILQQRDVLVNIDYNIFIGALFFLGLGRTAVVVVDEEVDGATIDGCVVGHLIAIAQSGVLVQGAAVVAVEHVGEVVGIVDADAIC